MSAVTDTAPAPPSLPLRLWQRVAALSWTGRIGLVIVLFVVLVAIFAPWLVTQDPTSQSMLNRNSGFSAKHWLGTDGFGRDVYSRLILGTRYTIVIASVALGLAAAMGILLGLVAAYNRGRWIDSVIVLFCDILLTFPTLVLGVVVVAVLGQGTINVGIAIMFAFLPRIARMARGVALGLVTSEFIEAARAIGASPSRIVLRHLLPNVLSEMTAITTVWLATAIRVETSLSFLGLGVQPPTPSWGLMVREGIGTLYVNPWPSLMPVIAIFVVIIGLNMLVDGATEGRGARNG